MTDKCDICGEIEDWDHILRFPIARNDQSVFIAKLNLKLSKIRDIDVERRHLIKNLEIFFSGHRNIDGTQNLIGYRNIFRGVIVRDWFGNDTSESKYCIANKILVHECVSFYCKMWLKRNDRRNSEQCRKQRLVDWLDEEVQEIGNSKYLSVTKFIRAGYDQIRKMSADAIQRWLFQLHALRKKSEKSKMTDIRTFMVPMTRG